MILCRLRFSLFIVWFWKVWPNFLRFSKFFQIILSIKYVENFWSKTPYVDNPLIPPPTFLGCPRGFCTPPYLIKKRACIFLHLINWYTCRSQIILYKIITSKLALQWFLLTYTHFFISTWTFWQKPSLSTFCAYFLRPKPPCA